MIREQGAIGLHGSGESSATDSHGEPGGPLVYLADGYPTEEAVRAAIGARPVAGGLDRGFTPVGSGAIRSTPGGGAREPLSGQDEPAGVKRR